MPKPALPHLPLKDIRRALLLPPQQQQQRQQQPCLAVGSDQPQQQQQKQQELDSMQRQLGVVTEADLLRALKQLAESPVVFASEQQQEEA